MGDSVFTPRPPEVGFAAAGAMPPGALYVFPGEQLVVDSWSSTAPAPLHIKARILTAEGRIQTSAWMHTPNSDRSQATTYHDLAEGWLLHVNVIAGSTAYRRGHCYVRVSFQRGQGVVGLMQGLLIADYVTGIGGLVWPGGQIRSSVEGPGLIRSVTGADPAAGAEILVTVPAGARWALHTMLYELTTSATVASRSASVLIDDGAVLLYADGTGYGQAASMANGYFGGDHERASMVSGVGPLFRIPRGFPLAAGYRIRTVTSNLQAGDNYTAPQLLVEEWIEP